jgi:hypothetical protein
MKKYLWLGLLPLFMAGCLDRKLPTDLKTDSDGTLAQKSVPAIVSPGRSYTVSVALEGVAAGDIPSVTLEVMRESTTEKLLTVQCYDDGDHARSGNGDVVAFDNIYSQRISWPTMLKGSIKVVFQFSIPNRSISALRIPVSSMDVKPPLITAVQAPDSLKSGFSGTKKIEVTVADSTGLDDIFGVLLNAYQNGTRIFSDTLYDDGAAGDAVAHDGHCTLAMDNSYGAGKRGAYELQLQAMDKGGLTSPMVKRNLVIENGIPKIVEVAMNGEVQRPASGTITFLIEASINDPQGIRDIKQVRLSWQKPDGSFPAASPYMLYDNGLAFDLSKWDYGYRGDLVANDGTYSIRGVFDSGNSLGVYTLGFIVEDLVGNKSSEMFFKVTLK